MFPLIKQLKYEASHHLRYYLWYGFYALLLTVSCWLLAITFNNQWTFILLNLTVVIVILWMFHEMLLRVLNPFSWSTELEAAESIDIAAVRTILFELNDKKRKAPEKGITDEEIRDYQDRIRRESSPWFVIKFIVFNFRIAFLLLTLTMLSWAAVRFHSSLAQKDGLWTASGAYHQTEPERHQPQANVAAALKSDSHEQDLTTPDPNTTAAGKRESKRSAGDSNQEFGKNSADANQALSRRSESLNWKSCFQSLKAEDSIHRYLYETTITFFAIGSGELNVNPRYWYGHYYVIIVTWLGFTTLLFGVGALISKVFLVVDFVPSWLRGLQQSFPCEVPGVSKEATKEVPKETGTS